MPELESSFDYVFAHGWAMHDSFFKPLIEQLKIESPHFCSRDYFGASVQSPACKCDFTKPWVGIGHSFGFARLLKEDLSNCRRLISICGFFDFCGEGGADPRVVQRMIRKFERNPETVVMSFLTRCGMGEFDQAPVESWSVERLKHDLELMAMLSESPLEPVRSIHGVPIFALAAEGDPIVPLQLSLNQFSNLHVCPEGGHLLGLDFPELCAATIAG